MMRPSPDLPEVFICTEPVDFRKGIAGLSVLVEEFLEMNPFSEQLFVFTNRRRNQVKVLYWERNGFCLWQKRLEQDRFYWPRPSTKQTVCLSSQQLNWLLDGYDISAMIPHKKLNFSTVL